MNKNLRFVLPIVLALSGCSALTGSLIKTLPYNSQATYDAGRKQVIANVNQMKLDFSSDSPSRAHIPLQVRNMRGKVLVMPVVYNWSCMPPKAGFPQFWPIGEHAGGVQWMTEMTRDLIAEGLKARGLDVMTTDGLKSNYGTVPGGRGYAYVSDKLKSWGGAPLATLEEVVKNKLDASVYVRYDSYWNYVGHSQMDGEAVVNHDVRTEVKVIVCTFGGCHTVAVPPVDSKNPMASWKAVDEGVRGKHNRTFIEHASQINAAIALHAFDAAATVGK